MMQFFVHIINCTNTIIVSFNASPWSNTCTEHEIEIYPVEKPDKKKVVAKVTLYEWNMLSTQYEEDDKLHLISIL